MAGLKARRNRISPLECPEEEVKQQWRTQYVQEIRMVSFMFICSENLFDAFDGPLFQAITEPKRPECFV